MAGYAGSKVVMPELPSQFLQTMRLGHHDMGGAEELYTPLDLSTHDYELWELRVHATLFLLRKKNLLNADQLRKGIEEMQPAAYAEAGYYERWAVSLTKLVLEKGVISKAAFDARFGIGPDASETSETFSVGDKVRVRAEDTRTRWRKPHIRTPGYIFGAEGVVERICGSFPDPMLGAFGSVETKEPLYRVRFNQREIWPEYSGGVNDTIEVEIFQNWLEEVSSDAKALPPPSYSDACPIRWDGSWVKVPQLSRTELEKRTAENEKPPSRYQPLGEALVDCCLDAGVYGRQELAETVETLSKTFGEDAAGYGRNLIARAWTDPDFKALLLRDWKAAMEELDIPYTPAIPPQGLMAKLIVLENTPAMHNLVVCTLCSCSPSYLLGNPPAWYKSSSYRARAVREPRKVLVEFGVDLPETVEVRVHDSSADMRYLVLPQRPSGTEGWSEAQLKSILTRDSMLGCGIPNMSQARL